MSQDGDGCDVRRDNGSGKIGAGATRDPVSIRGRGAGRPAHHPPERPIASAAKTSTGRMLEVRQADGGSPPGAPRNCSMWAEFCLRSLVKVAEAGLNAGVIGTFGREKRRLDVVVRIAKVEQIVVSCALVTGVSLPLHDESLLTLITAKRRFYSRRVAFFANQPSQSRHGDFTCSMPRRPGLA